jgi:hypothetical protein
MPWRRWWPSTGHPGAQGAHHDPRYLGPVRRAGQGTLIDGTPDREDLVLAQAGFENFERHIVPGGQIVDRTADDIVAWVFSRSDSAPHLFGDRLVDSLARLW